MLFERDNFRVVVIETPGCSTLIVGVPQGAPMPIAFSVEVMRRRLAAKLGKPIRDITRFGVSKRVADQAAVLLSTKLDRRHDPHPTAAVESGWQAIDEIGPNMSFHGSPLASAKKPEKVRPTNRLRVQQANA